MLHHFLWSTSCLDNFLSWKLCVSLLFWHLGSTFQANMWSEIVFETQYENFVHLSVHKSFKSYQVDCSSSSTFTSVQGHYVKPPLQLNLWWGSKAPFKSNIISRKSFEERWISIFHRRRYQQSHKIVLAWCCGLFCLKAVLLWSNRWYLCHPTIHFHTILPSE